MTKTRKDYISELPIRFGNQYIVNIDTDCKYEYVDQETHIMFNITGKNGYKLHHCLKVDDMNNYQGDWTDLLLEKIEEDKTRMAEIKKWNRTNKTRKENKNFQAISKILNNVASTGDFLSVKSIIKLAHPNNTFYNPVYYFKGKGHSHPYWKTLSRMMDSKDALYCHDLERVKVNGIYKYRFNINKSTFRKAYYGI